MPFQHTDIIGQAVGNVQYFWFIVVAFYDYYHSWFELHDDSIIVS